MQERDWAGVGELIAEDAVVEWPATGERIVGRDNYVAINSEYPEGWAIQVVRILGDGEQVASEVNVPHDELGMFTAASFWVVRDGLVVSGTEYWTSPGSEEPPPGRAQYVQRG
jgi:ketosteroid isomerase-like protein